MNIQTFLFDWVKKTTQIKKDGKKKKTSKIVFFFSSSKFIYIKIWVTLLILHPKYPQSESNRYSYTEANFKSAASTNSAMWIVKLPLMRLELTLSPRKGDVLTD